MANTKYITEWKSRRLSDAVMFEGLFGAVTLTKNADIDKYGNSGYGIGFDRK